MTTRFERLFELHSYQYICGSPIILVAGALSKDNVTGSIVAQLKFQSVSEKRIKAVKISLSAFDISKAEIQGITDYQYLEINVSNGQEFGANKAIVMHNPVTRSFDVSSLTVVFDDETIWKSSSSFEKLPALKALSFDNAEMEKQYRLSTNEKAKYTPIEYKDLWQCACGIWNSGKNCSCCAIAKDTIFSSYNSKILTYQLNLRLKNEAEELRVKAENEAKRIKEQEFKKKELINKTKRIAVITVPILVAIILFTQWFLPDVIQPAITYIKAEKMLSTNQYDDAIKTFESLGEYRDSAEMVIESKYQKACYLSEIGDYEKSLSIFIKIEKYKDCDVYIENITNIINEETYNEAIKNLIDKNYEIAIDKFKFLEDYKDSPSYLEKAKYQYACVLLKKSQYSKAKKIFKEISGYSDSKTMINECDYLIAKKHLSNNNYEKAISLFKQLNNYKESQSYLSECKYLKAKVFINNGNYSNAVSLLSEIPQYKDASKYIQLIKNVKSLVFLGETTSFSWEYIWIVSEINTNNCTSRLVVYEGRADGTKETIDITYREGSMLKEWINKNGVIYITEDGKNYSESNGIFRTWKVSGDWNSIYEKTYECDGTPLGNPGEYDVNWIRVDEKFSQTIKESFISYFEINEYGAWDSEDWIVAKATLKK